jgi:O-antigen ligase
MKSSARSFRRDLPTAVRVLLIACVFITPGVFDLGAVKPFDIVKVTTVLFFGWLALGVWAACAIGGRARPRRFLMGWLAGAYLLVATIATLLSPTRWTSVIGWYGRHHGLLTIVIYVAIFFVIAWTYTQRRDRAHELVYAMAGGAIVLTLYILMQRFGLDPIRWARPSGEAPGLEYFGTMGNANFAGGYLALTMPWVYLAYRRARATWWRIAIVVWAVVQLYALWLTSARNGIIGALPAAIAVIGFIHIRRARPVVKWTATAAAAAAVALVAIVAVAVVWHPGSDRPPKMFRRADIFRSQTVKVRGHWWLAGVKMFADRPVQGWGPDSFVTQYHRYLGPEARKVGDSETADKPHNVFVEHLAHTGILGFGAYLALLVVAFRRLFRRIRAGGGRDEPLLITLAGLLAAYAGQAVFSIDVTAIALVGWVTLGLIAAVADVPDEPAAARPRRRRVLSALAIVLGVLLAALSTAPLKADHEVHTAQRLANDDAFIDEVMGHHEAAFRWNPFVPQYRAIAAAYLETQATKESDDATRRDYLERALSLYEKADELQPDYHGWQMALGKVTAQLAVADGPASFEGALELIDDAERLAPHDWRVPTHRGDVYNLRATAEGDTDFLCDALDSYTEATRMRPKAGEAWTGVGRTLARMGRPDDAVDALRRAVQYEKRNKVPEQLIDAVKEQDERGDTPKLVKC